MIKFVMWWALWWLVMPAMAIAAGVGAAWVYAHRVVGL